MIWWGAKIHETVTPALFAITASRGRWKAADHLLMLSDKLTQVAAGELKRLMVFFPPRHGKSELISKYFPAWYLGHHPDHRVILASYEADFAASWGWKARNVFEEYAPEIFGYSVRSDSSARNRWDIKGYNGGMNTAGVGGAITGKGANCLIGSTPIVTSDGTKTIETLVGMQNRPLVLSYNHETGHKEWGRVVATNETICKSVLEIETVRGRKIRTTREHRFFVDQRGYTEAHSLRAGDRVYVTTIAKKQDVSTLWTAEEGSGGIMSGVLSKAAGSSDNNELHSMRERIRDACLRLHKGAETRANRLLLFKRVLSKTPCRKKCKKMCSMQLADAWGARQQILLRQMQSGSKGCLQICNVLSRMWKTVSSTKPFNSILWLGLCMCGAFKTDDRSQEPKLQRRDELFETVPQHETINQRTRSTSVCGMQDQRGVAGTSHRWGRDEQYPRESYNDVSDTPPDPSQIEYDTISKVRELSKRADRVYDLQVEGNNNFFAGEILVHNCLLIDDPVKNAEDANSELKRDKAWDWYQSTAYTRLEPGGAIILIMTRWHPDDLGGLLLKEMEAGGEQWDVLKFPAIAEEGDLSGRTAGDPLWKERYPIESLQTIQSTVSAYWWAAMYQQTPYSRTGGTFKRHDFIIVEGGAQGDQVRFWDLAATEAKQGKDPDWTVGCLMSEQGGRYWIKDIVRVRSEASGVERVIRQTAQLDGIQTRIFMEQEGGASGKSLISHYARNILKGYSFEGIHSTGSKPTRAQPLAAAVSNGNVHLVLASWNTGFLEEAEQFPTTKAHDDQIDAASQAFNLLYDPDEPIDSPLPTPSSGAGRFAP